MLERRKTVTITLVLLLSFLSAYDLIVRKNVFHNATQNLSNDGISSSHQNLSPSQSSSGEIKDRVAIITDTKWTARLIPLILHFHAVLGPDWPIVFFTTPELIAEHLDSTDPKQNVSASWDRAIQEKTITIRTIEPTYNMSARHEVNLYLTNPWLWNQLAPAQHVLVFQADSILCSNSHRKIEDFLDFDFIGSVSQRNEELFNGGLSLRNRAMMLDIIREEESWDSYQKSKKENTFGEDYWYSAKMRERGAKLPDADVASMFSCQHPKYIERETRPLGYHKVHHRRMRRYVREIAKWCPEIALAERGAL